MIRLHTRILANALIVTMAYSPLLGAVNGTVASAQAVQNSTSTYQYDRMGNLKQATDPLQRTTDLDYDELSRLKSTTQPSPGGGAARPVVGYGYDGLDQVTTVTDPRNLVTGYTVDGLGNRTLQSSPDTGATQASYDPAGNVKTRIDARGQSAYHHYDAINRLIRIDTTTGASSTFEYDGGAIKVPNASGKLTRITDESGTTGFVYDAFGRLTEKLQKTYDNSFKVAYAYNASGSLASVTYPSGNRVNYVYDATGQLISLTLNPVQAGGVGTDVNTSVVLLKEVTYAPFGGISGWKWGNSTAVAVNGHQRTYDLDGRVTSYILKGPGADTVVRTIAYDPAGRITGFTHAALDGTPVPLSTDQTFTYDGLDRLTSYTGNGTAQTYSYDATGNRTAVTFGANGYTNTIDPSSNKLSSTTGPLPAKTNTYDAAGNLQSDGTLSYTYTSRGRLGTVKNGTLTVTQRFNAFGQRVQNSDGGMFVYDEQGHLIGEYTNYLGKMSRETVYLGDLPVAVLTQTISGVAPTQVTATNVFHITPDHLGTPRVVARASDNKVVWRWDNGDPFGLTPPNANPSGLGPFTFNLRMPGQYYDRYSNLFYNYFRDYDPQTGRYVQSDPIGLAGGINTYGYVEANPLSKIDPMGLQSAPGDFSIPRPRPLPTPGDVFIPGTEANNAFVASANRFIKIVKDACKRDPSNEACRQEAWDQLMRDEAECLVARAGYGKSGQARCLARAKEYYSESLRKCDGK